MRRRPAPARRASNPGTRCPRASSNDDTDVCSAMKSSGARNVPTPSIAAEAADRAQREHAVAAQRAHCTQVVDEAHEMRGRVPVDAVALHDDMRVAVERGDRSAVVERDVDSPSAGRVVRAEDAVPADDREAARLHAAGRYRTSIRRHAVAPARRRSRARRAADQGDHAVPHAGQERVGRLLRAAGRDAQGRRLHAARSTKRTPTRRSTCSTS